MQYRVFFVPIFDDGTFEDELNRFLCNHKVVEVNKHYSEATSVWTFCVTYIETNYSAVNTTQSKKEKIDYKEVLDELSFARFVKLREARKLIASSEALPVYAVFTNEELAQIASLEEITESGLASIKGIGNKKNEKYGRRLKELFNNPQTQ